MCSCSKIVVAGHLCLDITPGFIEGMKKDVGDIFSPGKLTNMSGVSFSTGGAVSNTGVTLLKLGIDTKLMGKIGNDYFGEIVQMILRENGAGEGMIVVDGARTSYTVILAPPGVDRMFLHDPGANDTFCADDIDYDAVRQVQLFHFGYPPLMKRMYESEGDELVKIFTKVKEMGIATSLDMTLPDSASESGMVDWDSILKRLLPYVDIFVPSIEETLYMIEREEYSRLRELSKGRDVVELLDMNILQKLGQKLLDYGTKIVVIKCGKKGYYIRTQGKDILMRMGNLQPADIDNWANRELIEEIYHVQKVVSTTGAGDASIAGFLAAFINGRSIEEAVRIACAVGAECVQAYDAFSGVKTWNETINLIQNGWEKERIHIGGQYWKYDGSKGCWVGRYDKWYNA